MSLKKTVSISFLLFVNMVVLAHSVIFHHHESQQPAVFCNENQEHYCDEDTGRHECPGTENAHKCCTIENCFLDNPFTKADVLKLTKPVFIRSHDRESILRPSD